MIYNEENVSVVLEWHWCSWLKLSGRSNNTDCRETGTNNLVKKLVISNSFVFCCMFLYISFCGAMMGTILCLNLRHISWNSQLPKNYQLWRCYFRDWWSAEAFSQQHQNILHFVAHRVLSTLQCPSLLTQQHKSQELILQTWESISWNLQANMRIFFHIMSC